MDEHIEKQIEQLRAWGYEVEQANEFAMYVDGAGLSTYVNIEGADDQWEALTDLAAHAERSTQMVETTEETEKRQADERQAIE